MLIIPLVAFMSIALYVMIIILLPFNTQMATLLLFTLIAFWSRLPGVAVNDPTWLLYCADLIDVFSMIIAINIGGMQGAIFAFVTNVVPRFCGFYPVWISVMYDAIAQFIVCLMIPFIHIALGGDILISMSVYTLIRIIIIMPISYFLYPRPLVRWILEWISGLFGVFLANVFWAKLFGDYFDGLLARGAGFDWLLFLFATVVMLVFYLLYSSRKGSSVNVSRIVKNLIKNMVDKKNNDVKDECQDENDLKLLYNIKNKL